MVARAVIAAVLLAGAVAQGQTLLSITNTRDQAASAQSGDGATTNVFGPVGSFRITYTVESTPGVPVPFDGESFRLEVYAADGFRVQNLTPTATPEINPALGQVRYVIPTLGAGEYRVRGYVTPVGGDTNQTWAAQWHRLTVTNFGEAAAGDINITNTVSVGATTVTNIFNAGAFAITVNNTNITYITGGIVSSVVEGVENSWDAGAGALTINTGAVVTAAYTSLVEVGAGGSVTGVVEASAGVLQVQRGNPDAVTLEGYTAQDIADLPRSTADFSYYAVTWAPTVTLLRANGPRQRLATEGPTWISVPAGATNSGYTLRLDIEATTNQITWLPDNLIISTNIFYYTNRTMVFLADNAFAEVGVGLYSLIRSSE